MRSKKKTRRASLFQGRRILLAGGLWLGIALAFPSWASTVGVVNVNTASTAELQLLPGVGAQRAAAIVAMRQERGGFARPEDLVEVEGIGPVMLERMRPHVATQGDTTARRVRRESPAAGGPR